MSAAESRFGLVGTFAHEDALMAALRRAREQDLEVRDVYSPVPLHEAEELLSPRRSPVRFITFFGGVAGLVGGMALAIGSSVVWNLIVGGKPVTASVPFIVVGFEMTILLGALATLLGLFLLGRLPHRRFPDPAFRPEFTRDRYGVWLVGPSADAPKARALLEEADAVAIESVSQPAPGGRRGRRAAREEAEA